MKTITQYVKTSSNSHNVTTIRCSLETGCPTITERQYRNALARTKSEPGAFLMAAPIGKNANWPVFVPEMETQIL